MEKYGLNELVEGKKKSTIQIFLEQFKDFLVIILIVAAVVSGILGDAESAIVILVVITINAILGTVQTVKAEQSLNSLKELSAPLAKVLRDGNVIQIPSKDFVWCKCISGSQHRRFLYVCSSAGCCSDSGSTQFYRDDRAVIWNTEDGKRACNYP